MIKQEWITYCKEKAEAYVLRRYIEMTERKKAEELNAALAAFNLHNQKEDN